MLHNFLLVKSTIKMTRILQMSKHIDDDSSLSYGRIGVIPKEAFSLFLIVIFALFDPFLNRTLLFAIVS